MCMMCCRESTFCPGLWNSLKTPLNLLNDCGYSQLWARKGTHFAESFLIGKWSLMIDTNQICRWLPRSANKDHIFSIASDGRSKGLSSLVSVSPQWNSDNWISYTGLEWCFFRKKIMLIKINFFHLRQNSRGYLLSRGVKHKINVATCLKFDNTQMSDFLIGAVLKRGNFRKSQTYWHTLVPRVPDRSRLVDNMKF